MNHFPESLFAFIAAHEDDDLPDGAWFATLEAAAEQYNEDNGTDFDPNDAAHAYLRSVYTASES